MGSMSRSLPITLTKWVPPRAGMPVSRIWINYPHKVHHLFWEVTTTYCHVCAAWYNPKMAYSSPHQGQPVGWATRLLTPLVIGVALVALPGSLAIRRSSKLVKHDGVLKNEHFTDYQSWTSTWRAARWPRRLAPLKMLNTSLKPMILRKHMSGYVKKRYVTNLTHSC